MSKYRLLMAILLAAVLALAGFGGGSGSSPAGGNGEGTMMPAQRAAADTDLKAAKTAVDNVMDDSEDTTVTAVVDAVAAAKRAVEAASDAGELCRTHTAALGCCKARWRPI